MKTYITYEKLSNSKCMTAKHILPFQRFSGISFSIMNTFEGSQDFFSKLHKMYHSLFRTDLKIRLFKFKEGTLSCLVTQSVS